MWGPLGFCSATPLFNIYMLPLAQIMEHYNILYTDDTQQYISVSPYNSGPLDLLG